MTAIHTTQTAAEHSRAVTVRSEAAIYTEEHIVADYQYSAVEVRKCPNTGEIVAAPVMRQLKFQTERRVPKTGIMLVGLGGNNGSTVYAGIVANRRQLSWRTKEGIKSANWTGSLLLASTCKLGLDAETGKFSSVPLSSLLPLLNPTDLVISGWDISGMPLGDAMRRAGVIDISLQDQLYDELQKVRPLPGVYHEDFIAMNQGERADNVLKGSIAEQLRCLRKHIKDFKTSNSLEKIIVLWTATTERFCEETAGVHDTADALLKAIEQGHTEIAPSTLYGVAATLEGCSFINGSPQNTCVPGLIELARRNKVFVGGDDFKSGQTKIKSVLVDFLISAGIKPLSIVSYNHLGNNDGRNLSSPKQFRSKEISKSTVVDDMVNENKILYSKPGEAPDHCVVIKYVPAVGDSKRALDEYSSEIFLGGINTISLHNTCEDSLLAAPIIIDLILLTELCERISVARAEDPHFEKFDVVLSLLSYLCKAPLVSAGTPVVNALNAQRAAIVNVMRAALGLPPESHMCLEHRLPSLLAKYKAM